MREILGITGALADENRLRVLAALGQAREGELCVCQVVELLALAASTVSKHLWILRQAGLVESRKEGKWMYYRLPREDDDVPAVSREVLAWLLPRLTEEKRIENDGRRLKRILKVEPETLCCMQRDGVRCC